MPSCIDVCYTFVMEQHKVKTHLILPFKGSWIVGNGGRDPKINNHLRADGTGPKNQMFAIDFVKEHKGEGKNLPDYIAFGQEVIAPAEGIICQVIDGSIDNEIEQRDQFVIIGNAIVIDHHNGEYSVLCHFKQGSIRVKVGEKIRSGQTLGLCGNTGNSSEPHIHYHLQNHPLISQAEGLPIQFSRILVNNEPRENIELVRGQVVKNL